VADSPPGVGERYSFLQQLSPAAGALALDFWRRRAELTIESKGPQDFVTRADRAVEDFIRGEIARAFPGDGFLGEETVSSFAGTHERLWIVDPIDGTHNFLRGIPFWNVSIAYVERGERTLGAVFDPASGELFHGRRGGGAWRRQVGGGTGGTAGATAGSAGDRAMGSTENSAAARPTVANPAADVRLVASAVDELPGAVIAVGHHDRSPDYRYLAVRRELMDVNVAFRNFGCAALQLAHVAEGRIDAYVELELSAWDAMAGLLLVDEAGGWTGPFPGSGGLTVRAPVIASARGLGAPLARIVAAATS
jgi:myo-inositol-1(or 4)-monophosphatase